MAPTGVERDEDKGAADIIADLWQLCRDYAKQETVDPLKTLGGLFKYGVIGSVVLTIGLVFGTLAVLRGIQTEGGSAVTGSLDVLPYLAAFAFALVAVALAIVAIKRPSRAQEHR